MVDSMPGTPRTVRSVEHAIALLKALQTASGPLTLSALARAVSLSTASTYHLMRTLELADFVARDEKGLYRLSWAVYELGSVVARSVDLTRSARFFLDQLADDTGEAVLLAIAEGDSVLYLDRGQSNQSFAMVADLGRRAPQHTNASGKLLLAHRRPDEIRGLIDRGLTRMTQFTITDARRLMEELDKIRATGYAACWQEQEIGLNSVSVPILDYRQEVCAALTIAGPSARLTRRGLKRVLPLLFEKAAAISARVGGRLDPSGPGGVSG